MMNLESMHKNLELYSCYWLWHLNSDGGVKVQYKAQYKTALNFVATHSLNSYIIFRIYIYLYSLYLHYSHLEIDGWQMLLPGEAGFVLTFTLNVPRHLLYWHCCIWQVPSSHVTLLSQQTTTLCYRCYSSAIILQIFMYMHGMFIHADKYLYELRQSIEACVSHSL